MGNDAALLTAIGGLLTAIVAALISVANYRRGARKDALALANEQIALLNKQVGALRADYDALWRSFQKEREAWEVEQNRLNKRIENIERQNEELLNQVSCLERERGWLKFNLDQKGIEVPPMPADWMTA
jgi:chromosome segregation ATPase